MAQYLPFWPKAALGGYLANTGSSDFFSKALPTNGFTEVVIQMEIDATFGTNVATTVEVVPQISNDGTNWEDLAPSGLSAPANGTYPWQDTEKFTDIGAFMRMKIILTNTEGAVHYMPATVHVTGTGRS